MFYSVYAENLIQSPYFNLSLAHSPELLIRIGDTISFRDFKDRSSKLSSSPHLYTDLWTFLRTFTSDYHPKVIVNFKLGDTCMFESAVRPAYLPAALYSCLNETNLWQENEHKPYLFVKEILASCLERLTHGDRVVYNESFNHISKKKLEQYPRFIRSVAYACWSLLLSDYYAPAVFAAASACLVHFSPQPVYGHSHEEGKRIEHFLLKQFLDLLTFDHNIVINELRTIRFLSSDNREEKALRFFDE